MKTRYKILLVFGIILVLLFASFVILKITLYETWENNDHWHSHPNEYKVECEFVLFGNPGSCIALNENGRAIEARTELASGWKKIHSGPSPFGVIIPTNEKQCEEKGFVWYENECLWVVEKTFNWKKWYTCGKPCEVSIEMSDEKRMEIRGYIVSVGEAGDSLREKHNIHINTISTDHENHALRIGIDLKELSDSEIKDIEKQIRKIVGDEINITIEHSEPIYFR